MFHSLKQRIVVMITAVTLGLFFVMTGLTYFAQQRDENDAKREMKEKVEIAYRLVEHFAALGNSGVLTEAEAKVQARSALSAVKFGRDGYYFISTNDGYIVLMPPRRDLENTSHWEFRDENGFAFFQEAARVSEGGGYVTYRGVRFGDSFPNELHDKISYVAQYQPWGWVIGSGIYRDGIADNTRYLISRLGYVFGLVWVLLIAGMVAVIYPVPGFFQDMMIVITKVRAGEMNIPVPHTRRKDEMGDFARAIKAILGRCATQYCDMKNPDARRVLIEKSKLIQGQNPP